MKTKTLLIIIFLCFLLGVIAYIAFYFLVMKKVIIPAAVKILPKLL